MNQIGDIYTFYSVGTLPGSATPAYVWKFWDGNVAVSAENRGTVTKRLNLGGNPAEGGGPPYVIPYRVEICDMQTGEVVQIIPSTLEVNNPPTVYGAPTITPNNQAFPFQTAIQVQAYDLENNGVGFYWYYGTNAVGGLDVTTGPVNVAGTYYGTLIGSNRDKYTNTLTSTIYGQGTVYTCKLVDNDGGTQLLNIPVQGYDATAPQFSVAARPDGVTVDGSTLPDVVIAPGQVVNFVTFAYDTAPGGIVFTWYLYGTNGWNQPGVPIVSNGVTTSLERGYRNDFVCSIEDESLTGLRTAIVLAQNTTTGLTAEASISVNLVQNSVPQVTSVGIYSPVTEQALGAITKSALPTRTIVRFSGTSADADDDSVYYKWQWTTPATDMPGNYLMYGRDCFVDVSTWPSGVYSTLGFVTVYDKYGAASADFALPQVTIN